MWKLTKEFRFEAAHHLPNHDGKCRRVHGHSWKMKVTVCDSQLIEDGPKAGMVMDFFDLKSIVQPLVDSKLDHWDLNETLPVYPTSENIAKLMFDWIEGGLDRWPVALESVEISETCTSSCIYHRAAPITVKIRGSQEDHNYTEHPTYTGPGCATCGKPRECHH